MTRPRRRMAQLAELRSQIVELADERVTVWEPTALIYAEYRELLKAKKRREAVAHLIGSCCKDDDGTDFFDADEAFVIAGGRAEVFTPIVTAITGFVKLEKKLSPPMSESSTDSPPISDAPSGNSSAA